MVSEAEPRGREREARRSIGPGVGSTATVWRCGAPCVWTTSQAAEAAGACHASSRRPPGSPVQSHGEEASCRGDRVNKPSGLQRGRRAAAAARCTTRSVNTGGFTGQMRSPADAAAGRHAQLGSSGAPKGDLSSCPGIFVSDLCIYRILGLVESALWRLSLSS